MKSRNSPEISLNRRARVSSGLLVVLSGVLLMQASGNLPVAAESGKSSAQNAAQAKKRGNYKHTPKVVKQLSVKDPECRPFSPSEMDWRGFSAIQKATFEEAYKLAGGSTLSEATKKYEQLAAQLESFQIFYNLGLIHAEAGDLAAAEQALKKSGTINPGNRETFKLLSQVLKRLGKDAESKAYMDRYLQL